MAASKPQATLKIRAKGANTKTAMASSNHAVRTQMILNAGSGRWLRSARACGKDSFRLRRKPITTTAHGLDQTVVAARFERDT